VPGIGVVNNPNSKKNIQHPQRMHKLGYILGEKGSARMTQSMDELEDCLEEFHDRKIDILAVNGGDGSLHITMTKLIELYGKNGTQLPMLAILRGGTLNTVARSFKIKGRPEHTLYNIADRYGEGLPLNTQQANLLKVNDRYSFLFGNGLIANFMHTYYTGGKPSPFLGVKTLFRGLGSAAAGTQLTKDWFKKVEAKVWVEGEELPLNRFTSILAATIPDIGVGFKPFFRAFERLDSFHVLFYTCTPGQFAAELPNIYMGRPNRPRMGMEMLAKRIVVEASEPFHYTQDGDMYVCRDGRMEISIGPRITVVVD
jgi:diacylglycerol kinase family enzyme